MLIWGLPFRYDTNLIKQDHFLLTTFFKPYLYEISSDGRHTAELFWQKSFSGSSSFIPFKRYFTHFANISPKLSFKKKKNKKKIQAPGQKWATERDSCRKIGKWFAEVFPQDLQQIGAAGLSCWRVKESSWVFPAEFLPGGGVYHCPPLSASPLPFLLINALSCKHLNVNLIWKTRIFLFRLRNS